MFFECLYRGQQSPADMFTLIYQNCIEKVEIQNALRNMCPNRKQWVFIKQVCYELCSCTFGHILDSESLPVNQTCQQNISFLISSLTWECAGGQILRVLTALYQGLTESWHKCSDMFGEVVPTQKQLSALNRTDPQALWKRAPCGGCVV